mmetsp:Transcript_23807/g.37645  ORF Transcript_23807/g.37645 Transcript_23807/m.37645 type:complete len:281 (-) Transcript_23807:2334-3176(-)
MFSARYVVSAIPSVHHDIAIPWRLLVAEGCRVSENIWAKVVLIRLIVQSHFTTDMLGFSSCTKASKTLNRSHTIVVPASLICCHLQDTIEARVILAIAWPKVSFKPWFYLNFSTRISQACIQSSIFWQSCYRCVGIHVVLLPLAQDVGDHQRPAPQAPLPVGQGGRRRRVLAVGGGRLPVGDPQDPVPVDRGAAEGLVQALGGLERLELLPLRDGRRPLVFGHGEVLILEDLDLSHGEVPALRHLEAYRAPLNLVPNPQDRLPRVLRNIIRPNTLGQGFF